MVSLYFLTGPMFDSVEILQRKMFSFRISFRIKICRIPAKFQNDYIKTELYQYSDDYTMSQEENQRKNMWLQTKKTNKPAEKASVFKNLSFKHSKTSLQGSFIGSWETSTAVSRALNRIAFV